MAESETCDAPSSIYRWRIEWFEIRKNQKEGTRNRRERRAKKNKENECKIGSNFPFIAVVAAIVVVAATTVATANDKSTDFPRFSIFRSLTFTLLQFLQVLNGWVFSALHYFFLPAAMLHRFWLWFPRAKTKRRYVMANGAYWLWWLLIGHTTFFRWKNRFNRNSRFLLQIKTVDSLDLKNADLLRGSWNGCYWNSRKRW